MKRVKAPALAAVWLGVATAAIAQDCAEQIMTCTLRGGTKTVQVCVNGQDATYRFGPTGGQP